MSAPWHNPSCTLCPLHHGVSHVGMDGDGPVPCDVLFVGDAPGAVEDMEGVPFKGAAGKLLREMISKHLPKGVTHRITNTVRCRPPDNRRPTAKEWKVCSEHYLREEVKACQPSLVVALGATAAWALTGQGGVLGKEGKTVPAVGMNGEKVMVLAHPAYVLRVPDHRPAWEQSWSTIRGILSPPDTKTSYRMLSPTEAAFGLMTFTRKDMTIAFDYETTGLDPWREKVISVALSNGEGKAVAFDPGEIRDVWTAFLRSNVRKIAHNIAFEGIWSLVHYGVYPVNVVWDTKLGAKIGNEEQRAGLKHLALLHTGMGDYASGMEVGGEGWETKTLLDVWRYNCQDADATYRIAAKQIGTVDRLLMRKSLHHTESLVRARHRGMPVDRERMDEVESSLLTEAKDKEEVIRRHPVVKVAFPGINLDSPDQLRHLFIDGLGISQLHRSKKTGRPSIDKAFFEKRKDDHELVAMVGERRKITKVVGTTLKGIREFLQEDGRVHPSFNVGGARTWRLSCSDPNLQNIPKDPFVRSIFRAPRDRVMLEADYSQIELRIMAALSGEEALIQAFREGTDVHTLTASRLFGVEVERVTESQRATGKRLNFGCLYGITEHGLEQKFDIPEDDGRRLLRAFWTGYPAVARWLQSVRSHVEDHGYALSPYGRRRHFARPGSDGRERTDRDGGHSERQAGNFPVQSAAAELTLDALVLLDREVKEAEVIGTVHDSILLLLPLKGALRVARQIREVMEERCLPEFLEGVVPVRVDMKIGPHWGAMTEVK